MSILQGIGKIQNRCKHPRVTTESAEAREVIEDSDATDLESDQDGLV